MSLYRTGLAYIAISGYRNIACAALNGGYIAGRALSMLPSCSYITTV